MATRTTRFVVYTDAAGEYRWTLFAANNRKMADSGEGYDSEQACADAAHKVASLSGDTQVFRRVEDGPDEEL